MTAVAIPFVAVEDAFLPLGCSPRSPSSFQHLSQSPSFVMIPPPALAQRQSSFNIKASLPIILPATPPPDATEIYAPTRSNRPTPVVPFAADLADVYSGSIIDNFRAALEAIDMDSCEAHGENAFFVCDLAEVWRQHMRWEKELGARVNAHFAVKCNPDPRVLHLLAALGLGFDCASQPEIQAVLNLPIAVDPSRIIYANPCKAPSFIRHAAANGVNYMTFDNADELAKIKKYHPSAKMVLRILTDDSGSLCRLGVKFGAPLSEARSLLKKAKALGVSVTGISFHCGSGCTNPALFGDAVRRAKWAFDVGREEGFEFDFLDIGGGFEDDTFEAIAHVLRLAIEEHFPLDGAGKGVRIIAEPGRYYVSRAFELATNIIARRAAREGVNDESGMNDLVMEDEEEEGEPSVMYYVNDGVYGAFNCIIFDHQVVQPRVLTLADVFNATGEISSNVDAIEGAIEACSVWGQSCDGIDVIQANAKLPTGLLQTGDWLRWESMGAYTICAASQFNGFRRSEVRRYTIDTKGDVEAETQIRRLMGL